jgi:type IV secretion system protein VirB10
MILTKRQYLIAGGATLLALALVVSAATVANRPDPVTVPELTPIHVTLDHAVTSKENRPGDHFNATVSEPVIIDGKTAIPRGARAEGVVVDAERSGRLMGRARLRLALERVDVGEQAYDLQTRSSPKIGGDHKKRNWALIGGGAGGGALIGAAAAGGKGALIGGPIGAAAGTTVAWMTGHKDIRLSPETPVTFRLAEPLTIDAKKVKS